MHLVLIWEVLENLGGKAELQEVGYWVPLHDQHVLHCLDFCFMTSLTQVPAAMLLLTISDSVLKHLKILTKNIFLILPGILFTVTQRVLMQMSSKEFSSWKTEFLLCTDLRMFPYSFKIHVTTICLKLVFPDHVLYSFKIILFLKLLFLLNINHERK